MWGVSRLLEIESATVVDGSQDRSTDIGWRTSTTGSHREMLIRPRETQAKNDVKVSWPGFDGTPFRGKPQPALKSTLCPGFGPDTLSAGVARQGENARQGGVRASCGIFTITTDAGWQKCDDERAAPRH